MTPANDPQVLLENLLDGEADQESRAALVEALRKDPALRSSLQLHLHISDSLSRLNAERQDQTFIHSTVGHAVALSQENETAFISGLTRRIARRRWSRRFALAAAITLAVTGGFFVHRQVRPLPIVASMIELDDHGRLLSQHDITPGYHHAPKNSLLKLNFFNGAIVAIEGPAEFRVESAMRLYLDSGKLNAWCPPAAHGFQVVTATGTVTDLGTSFGVAVDKTGSSDFMVLDGLIQVSQGKATRRLEEGQAVRTANVPGIKDLDFKTSPFTRTWPLASGILATSGSVRPAPPGTPEQLSKLEDNDSVFVIPEKRNVTFDRPILAEVVAPGTFSASNAEQLYTLRENPRKRLHSFLIRFNPVSNIGFRRFDGAVTFDRPVLAICCQGKYLDATDPMFATGSWTDVSEGARKYRGLDLNQPEHLHEEVNLSEDRRTVRIVFNAGVSSDDIRVILEDD